MQHQRATGLLRDTFFAQRISQDEGSRPFGCFKGKGAVFYTSMTKISKFIYYVLP